MKRLIALAVSMAALGAMAAMLLLRILSRPRVAPAPYGPAVPLPAPDESSGETPDGPRFAEADPAFSAADRAAVADFLETPSRGQSPSTMLTESGASLPDEVLTEERDSGMPAPSGAVAEPMGRPGPELPGGAEATIEGGTTALSETPAPDATDEVPSHHMPPPVSEVVGEPPALDAEMTDVEPSHVPPMPVSEVTGEHSEAVLEAEESLAVPVTEAIAQASEHAQEARDAGHDDFLTDYFEELAESPLEATTRETMPAEPDVAPSPTNEVDASMRSTGSALRAGTPAVPPRGQFAGTADAPRDAESFLDEGNVYFNVGQYGLAIERYGKALEIAPDLTAAYYNRANARTRAGEYDDALTDYDRALTLHPHDPDALNNRGMLHLYRASYPDALQDFNAALAMDPRDTTVMVNRGLAHLHGGDAAAALVDFQEAASLDGKDAAAHYGAGQAAATLANRDEALRHLSHAIELDASYAREAAADPKLQVLQGDDDFMRLLRASGSRAER